MVVLGNDSVHHCLELHIDRGDGDLGELDLKTVPDLLGSLLRLPLVDKVSLDLGENVPEGLVIFVILVILPGGAVLGQVHRMGSGDHPPEAGCTKKVLHEGCPSQVIGAVELGDGGTKRGGGGGGHIEFLMWGEHRY